MLVRNAIATAIAVAVSSGGIARADDPRPPATAAEAKAKPRPDAARNAIRDDRSWSRHLLWIPRGILFVPKWALWLGAAPVRGGLWAYDRYNVGPRLARLLSGDGPLTLFPSARLESGFGVTYGVGVAVSNVLGADDRLRFRFLVGGEVRQIYGAKLTSGTLFGARLDADLEAEIQLLKNTRYFGIGNDSGGDAIGSRFDQNLLRIELGVASRAARDVDIRATGAFVAREFDQPSDEDAVSATDAYGAAQLLGFDPGTGAFYSEVSATYDTRHQPSVYVSAAEPSTGWKLSAFAGYAYGIDDDPSRFLRYGFDAQRNVNLYRHDRILVLRLHGEGVTADLDAIPFTELPRLGGSRLLRAYPRGRFRDRFIAAASAEYRYPLHRLLQAFAFAEAGSALRTPGDVSASGLHPSVGGGFQLHTPARFMLRMHAAYGDDGAQLALSFNPSAQIRRRTKRR